MSTFSLPWMSLLLLTALAGCTSGRTAPVTVRSIGGPTALVEIGGARFLTDPTFSPPGSYPVTPERSLVKTEGPAVAPEDLGPVDAVLLSHDQHPDNLDPAGRAFVAHARRTFSTPLAASRLEGNVNGLAPWERIRFVAANGRSFTITAVPARHGPEGSEALTGPTTGFVIESPALPTVYVSGDNASVELVRGIAERVHVDVALLFAGGAKSPKLLGDALLTVDGERAASAARLLPNATIIPLHFRGCRHFSEEPAALHAALAAPDLAARVVLLAPGEAVTLPRARGRL